jgi:hypothetical protein
MFLVELKPASNNKDIFLVEYLQQCKIKFDQPKHKRDIAQRANCQRYGHTKTNAISHHDASNAQVTTPQSTETEQNARMMSDVFSVVAFIPLTTKNAPSTRNSNKNLPISQSHLPTAPLQHPLHTSPSIMYAKSPNNILLLPPLLSKIPNSTPPRNQWYSGP